MAELQGEVSRLELQLKMAIANLAALQEEYDGAKASWGDAIDEYDVRIHMLEKQLEQSEMKLRLAEQKSRNAGLDGLAALQSANKDDGDVAARKKEIAELKERVEELQVRKLTD